MEDPDAQAYNYHFYYKIFTKEFNFGFGSPRTDIFSFCEERKRLKFEQVNDEKQQNSEWIYCTQTKSQTVL